MKYMRTHIEKVAMHASNIVIVICSLAMNKNMSGILTAITRNNRQMVLPQNKTYHL